MAATDTYALWERHFGKPTTDEAVIAEYRRAGYSEPPVLDRDDSEKSVSDGDATVSIYHPASFGREDEFGDGVGLVAGVALHVRRAGRDAFAGPLPFDIQRDFTRKALWKALGEPDESDDDELWDVWMIDDKEVIVSFSKGFKQIETVAVFLPDD